MFMFLKDDAGNVYQGVCIAVHSESKEELAIVKTSENNIIAMTKKEFNEKLQQCNEENIK